MGDNFSSIVTTSSSTTNVSESNSASPNPGEQLPKQEAPDQFKIGEEADQTKGGDAQLDVKEEDEEGECEFSLFMKEGVCREIFTVWNKCVAEAEKNNENVSDKCFEVTSNLWKCMEAHADYYEPILNVEWEALEKFFEDLELEAA